MLNNDCQQHTLRESYRRMAKNKIMLIRGETPDILTLALVYIPVKRSQGYFKVREL